MTARLPQLPVKSRSEALKLTHIRISAQGVEPVKVILFPSQIQFTPNLTACLISETFVLVSTYPMTEPDQTKNKKPKTTKSSTIFSVFGSCIGFLKQTERVCHRRIQRKLDSDLVPHPLNNQSTPVSLSCLVSETFISPSFKALITRVF